MVHAGSMMSSSSTTSIGSAACTVSNVRPGGSERRSAARAAAKAEFRTVQGQVEFWAKVGRAALDNPDLPASFIAESLMSLAESREDSTPFVPRSSANRLQA